MATRNQRPAVETRPGIVPANPEAIEAARNTGGNAEVTRLDDHTDAPSITAPGDGPADTTDPTERATTVGGDKAAAARAGHLTVNAAIPLQTTDKGQLKGVAISYPGDQGENGTDGDGNRVETYPVTRPDGSTVTVRHNLDTGVTEIA
ncbi:MAG: hypothetical protein ABW156_05825 [Jiangellaceae bacterium]